MNKKILIDLIGILLIVLVIVVGYKLSPMLLPKSDVTLVADPACNLHRGPCSVSLPDGGRLEFESRTRPIPMVTPFLVEARITGLSARSVAVDFTGVDMSMGLNRPVLQEVTAGRFVGEASLPVCVTGEMLWQANVLIETDSARYAVAFRFVEGRN